MISFLKKHEILLFSLFYWMVSCYIILNFDGTGGEADSINHYLFAKYSVQQPELLLDHWAKPLFTLLAAPLAQFGFVGIKFFNVICIFFASLLVYRIAKNLQFNYPILAILFYYIFPISFTTTFSGLTEPLCALALSIAIFLFQQKKYLGTAILISFTPFLRSEGLLFIGVFGLLFIHHRLWKALLLLGTGHIIYSFVGYFHYKDILWVFTEIPYAHLSSHYGSGSLFHFAEKLNYLLGIPLLILFIVGILRSLLYFKSNRPSLNLITFLFLTFFIAHSLFWYLEVFNSMGLKRVFAAVSPLMALLCLHGFNFLSKIDTVKVRVSIMSIILTIILIFPFTSNPASVEWEDLGRTKKEENATRVAEYIKSNSIGFNRLICTDPYLYYVLDVNPFNLQKSKLLATKEDIAPSQLLKNDLVIWDNWHSVVDYGLKEESLSHLTLTKKFTHKGSVYKVYFYQPESVPQ